MKNPNLNKDSESNKALQDRLLVTKPELARALHVSPRTVEAWARKGKIPVMKLGSRCVRYHLDKVIAALERYETREVGR